MSRPLVRLLTWLSPSFPIGAFAYSHGLEAAVRDGGIEDAEAVFHWLETLLLHGSGWNDLVLFAAAHRAATARENGTLDEIAELAAALAGTAERRTETLALGAAFGQAARPWHDAGDAGDAEDYATRPYPVAVGRLAGMTDIALHEALTAYAHAFVANLVGAAIRLVPLGQSDAMAVLERLEPTILAAADRASTSGLDDLGSAAILSEIAAMRHETLSPRIFRS
ncbi:urease accessory protein UreF [Consotaella aegiceratis]|uniref:urease accessory protein UreF n=1 Tax=Consotaella aegiceratis TaxID=3097961 RepID=UPI002F3EEBD2